METSGNCTVWDRILGAALALPGVRVDRAHFLQTTLSSHVPSHVATKAHETRPATAGISQSVVKKAAKSSVRWHRTGVTATSAVAGLPGGWWIAGTIPADLTQYYFHALVVLQKLAYLHGWPPLVQADEDMDDETKLVFTLFIGVMLGAQGATTVLGSLAQSLAANAVKQLPKAALTKYAIYQTAKQVASWVGVKLTKKKFAEWLGRAIPLLGGLIAGGITWYAFGSGASRLTDHLETLPLARA